MTRERAWFTEGLKGKHVVGFVVAFFGLIFGVAALFTVLAVHTFPGDVSGAYRRGIRYNDTLAEAVRQDKLGWQVGARYEDGAGRVVVTVTDRNGGPLARQKVQLRAGRPTTARFDQVASMEDAGNGTYRAPLRLEPGSWDLEVRLNEDGPGQPFNTRLRLWIQPGS